MGDKQLKSVAKFTESVFDQYGRELQQFLMRRLHNSQNARDMAQEVYLRLLRISDSELVRNPQAYVYRVASHVIYEYKLRERNENVTYDSEAVKDWGDHPTEILPDQIGERLSSQQQLDDLLSCLPPLYREIFVLQKRDGWSYEEISEKLGISVHTVKKYLMRSLARLKFQAAHRKRS